MHQSETPRGVNPPGGGQTTVVVKQENGGDVTEPIPSPNRLSISYASGIRRLVINSDVVTSLKLFRQASKIEVALDLSKAKDGLKGVLVRIFSVCPDTVLTPRSALG